ncbi:acyltransferase family protein [Rossellomorea aquimaris]|uniref:acyltransferase family protein n=1 Tax=Rossellomorea aquimaris TaxID=189382 RepID=UPI0007D086FC|nr:acyltransferase family protein [Rossellomorea aquimaris]
MDKPVNVRRYDLDWIKVIATFCVFLYHCSMFFNPFEWHVKNNEVDSTFILAFSLLLGSWMMPIFFVISGISSYYSLQKRSAGTYLKERFIRLGIPLLFGVFILAPPQVYMERMGNHQFTGSFLDFIPHAFDGFYLEIGGTGNFAFFGLHLWYLLALLLFSLLTSYVFVKTDTCKKITAFHFLFVSILIILASAFVETVHLGGWDLVVYLLFFLTGYYIFSSSQLLDVLHRTFRIHLTVGLLSTILYTAWFMNGLPPENSVGSFLFTSLMVMSSFNLILSFYFLANKYLSFSNRVLKYSSEASLPFYILHQPVIVLIGYHLKDLSWSIPVKAVFLIGVSFTVIALTYHLVIRPVSFLRVLFGIKGKKRGISVETVSRKEVRPPAG